tara:strand:- start:492 stop:800 length:309 start_codon:yes stop_codon:yes gene_type:complete
MSRKKLTKPKVNKDLADFRRYKRNFESFNRDVKDALTEQRGERNKTTDTTKKAGENISNMYNYGDDAMKGKSFGFPAQRMSGGGMARGMGAATQGGKFTRNG